MLQQRKTFRAFSKIVAWRRKPATLPEPQRMEVVPEIDFTDTKEGQEILWRQLVRQGVWILPMSAIFDGEPSPASRAGGRTRRRPNGEAYWYFLLGSKAKCAAPLSRHLRRRRF